MSRGAEVVYHQSAEWCLFSPESFCDNSPSVPLALMTCLLASLVGAASTAEVRAVMAVSAMAAFIVEQERGWLARDEGEDCGWTCSNVETTNCVDCKREGSGRGREATFCSLLEDGRGIREKAAGCLPSFFLSFPGRGWGKGHLKGLRPHWRRWKSYVTRHSPHHDRLDSNLVSVM